MGCSKLISVDLKNLDFNKIKNINKMFYGCDNLKNIDISSFKCINSTIKGELFDNNNSTNPAQLTINKDFYNQSKINIPFGWKILQVK